MKKINKLVLYPLTTCLLAASLTACSNDKANNGTIVSDIKVPTDEALSDLLSSEYGVSISNEAAEFLDDQIFVDPMSEVYEKQVLASSYSYLSCRIKEDNPEYAKDNLNISHNRDSEPVITMGDNTYQLDSILEEYVSNVFSLEKAISNGENSNESMEAVRHSMMDLDVNEIEVKSPIVGSQKIYVK